MGGALVLSEKLHFTDTWKPLNFLINQFTLCTCSRIFRCKFLFIILNYIMFAPKIYKHPTRDGLSPQLTMRCESNDSCCYCTPYNFLFPLDEGWLSFFFLAEWWGNVSYLEENYCRVRIMYLLQYQEYQLTQNAQLKTNIDKTKMPISTTNKCQVNN